MTSERFGVPQDVYQRMVEIRRDLHRHPELSGDEKRTAAQVADELNRLGLETRMAVGGHGVTAEIAGRESGPCVALRADLDALPIQEETGLEFASERDGVMHACGHDGHAAMVLGAAAMLLAGKPPARPVRLLFQPSEERGSGALDMIEDGAVDDVGLIFGAHLDRHYPPGVLVVTDGSVNASSDQFSIHIHGQQGHGARPHEALDAIVVGSLLVTALQTIVSREVDPAHPSVISIGRFDAGSAANVIAGQAFLEGTIRAQEESVRCHLHEAIARIARAVGQLHGAEVDILIERGTPPVVNSTEMAELGRDAARVVPGVSGITELHTVNMGGEDFGFYLGSIPGCYIRVGGRIEGRESYPAHSSRFDVDEAGLAAGAAWFASVARLAAERLASEGPSEVPSG